MSATPLPRVTIHKPGPKLGNANRQLDSFMMDGGCGLLCDHNGVAVYVFPFLVKRREDVCGVGCLAQSEKSAEKFHKIVFRNGYTAYIGNMSRLGNSEYHAIETFM